MTTTAIQLETLEDPDHPSIPVPTADRREGVRRRERERVRKSVRKLR